MNLLRPGKDVVEERNKQNTLSLPSPSNKGEGLLFVPAADVVAEVKVPREPAPVQPTVIQAAPARLAPAAEVARVLKTLKLKPGAVLKVERGPSPEGVNGTRTGTPILAAAVAPGPAPGNAARAADTSPAFRGAALGNAPPRYPYAARVRGIEGDVLLRVVVLPDGKAAGVTMRITSGSTLLDRAAHDAVRGWRFRPAKRAGRTVVGWVDVPVSFRLTD